MVDYVPPASVLHKPGADIIKTCICLEKITITLLHMDKNKQQPDHVLTQCMCEILGKSTCREYNGNEAPKPEDVLQCP